MQIILYDRALRPTLQRQSVLRRREFWGIFFARAITSPVGFFIATWLFLFLHQVHGFNLRDMAMIAWIPFATADIGNIMGGYFSGRMVAGGARPIQARKRMMLIGALLMVSSFIVGLTASPLTAIAFSWGFGCPICWRSPPIPFLRERWPLSSAGPVSVNTVDL